MSNRGLYNFTSIGRPLDPAYPSNLAILWLIPLGAGLHALLASAGFSVETSSASAALSGGLAVLGLWALTRELAPDDNAAAFVSVALGFPAMLAFEAGSFLLLFTALLLVRIVNRSTGLPARLFDSLSLLGLVAFAAVSLEQPLLPVIAALAFLFDARLWGGHRRHYVGAVVCAAIAAYVLYRSGFPVNPALAAESAIALAAVPISLAFFAAIAATQHIESGCDVQGQRLDLARVRAGMLTGWLVPAQALVVGDAAGRMNPLIWACLLAVPLAMLARRSSLAGQTS